jgi:hypothetical protein
MPKTFEPTPSERLQLVWKEVAPLQDDETHHPHNEAFRAAVLKVRNILRPLFDPTPEDRISQLQAENEVLRAQLKKFERACPSCDSTERVGSVQLHREGCPETR